MTETGFIFDIKHFAVHDGPGIRTTVFFKGCPLRCQWCHSPESQSMRPEIGFTPDQCIRCGACVDACPTGAQTMEPEKIHRQICKGIGSCADACYPGALTFYGRRFSVEEVLEEVGKDRLLYETSGGGITLSGGEPTMQPFFCSALLTALKDEGYHITLDTCGHSDWETLENLLDDVDMVLYDIKHMEPKSHQNLTGEENGLILSNLNKISRLDKDLIIRVPVIPGINDSQDNLKAMAGYIGKLDRIMHVELLPYHNLGTQKYTYLGREYMLSHIQPPDPENLIELGDLLEAYGLQVIIEGVD